MAETTYLFLRLVRWLLWMRRPSREKAFCVRASDITCQHPYNAAAFYGPDAELAAEIFEEAVQRYYQPERTAG